MAPAPIAFDLGRNRFRTEASFGGAAEGSLLRNRLIAAVAALFVTSSCFSPADAQNATTFQINPAHSGQTTMPGFSLPLKRIWSVNLGGTVSYPLIAEGMVFVTVANTTGSYGTQLYALNATTGKTVWHKGIGGNYYWSNATYDNGKLFVVNNAGLLQEYAATTGVPGWSVPLPGQYFFSAAPMATGGQVFVGGAGEAGTLYAVNEDTGAVNWTGFVQNGDTSSPAYGDGGVYVSYPCQYYKFNPTTGQQIWNYNGGCDGGGGETPVYMQNDVFVRDPTSSDVILSAGTGKTITSFAADQAPALLSYGADNYDVTLSDGSVNLVDIATQNIEWSFSRPGLTTAPITVNNLIFEGSSTGELYALDIAGHLEWATNLGVSINAPGEGGVGAPTTGLAAGGGILVVPASSTLFAFAPEKSATAVKGVHR